MASAKVTILNHLTAMCRGIEEIRALALTDISEESLLDVIQNREVLPTRGDRRSSSNPRRRRKEGGETV
jgi:hypothetical protein